MNIENVLGELGRTNPKKVIVFTGSGLVKPLGYPSWADLLDKGVAFAEQFSGEVAAMMKARISKGRYIEAGSCFFEPEIPLLEVYRFLQREFDKTPAIPTTLRDLFSLPFSAFITTNFDDTIEQALAQSKRVGESYADKSRFKTFSSRLSVFADSNELRSKYGLVLKMHGSVRHPEEIVLGSLQFNALRQNDSFEFIYRRLISQYKILFLGFSGRDPNFEWHCQTLYDVCGMPAQTSYLLFPDSDPPSDICMKANIIPVAFSPANNFEQLDDFIQQLSKIYSTDVQILSSFVPMPIADETKDTLAFICAGIGGDIHSSAYQCALVSIVAEAAQAVGGMAKEREIVESISRTYHISAKDARQIFQQADPTAVTQALGKVDQSKVRYQKQVRVLTDGIGKRSKAFGKAFLKSESQLQKVVQLVLVNSLAKAGSGLALSLMDSEAPEASMVDRVIRRSIEKIPLSGFGELDKEILSSAFADLFTRPTREENAAIVSIAQAAVATALVVTFSGGIEKILELMPSEAYFDANVAIPLVAKDHPRSSNYHELVIDLNKIHCETLVLDVFLDEMTHHFNLAHSELREARIAKVADAKKYVDFHGSIRVNAFILAYANGGKEKETFQQYAKRAFGNSHPRESDFKRALETLGITVMSTARLDKAPSEPLAVYIASEKGRLMRLRPQVLAQHEAVQILWLHKEQPNDTVWFITEDAMLRRILRALPALDFSQDPPSRGVMPAYGAHLLIASLSDRPNFEKAFSALFWNPAYLEQIDTMLSSVLRKFSKGVKELRKLDLLQLRDHANEILRKEMVRNEKDAVRQRAKEFLEGEPQIVKSILRELGED